MKGISVIVCCYNGAVRLRETLKHLLAQRVSGFGWEIIIVDNASTDSTSALSNEILSKALPAEKFKVIYEGNPGLINARKKGISAAQFDHLLFCDDDNWLAEDYVQTAFEIMEQNPRMAILGGMGEPVFEGEKPAWFEEFGVNFAVGDQAPDSKSDLTQVQTVYGAGFVMRKAILQLLEELKVPALLSGRKGKEIISGEDTELCVIVRLLGYEVWYSRKLRFKHLMTTGRMNWQYLKKLYFGFGRMNIYLHAYEYFKTHSSVPSGLRFPLWLDTYIHKGKELLNYLPGVIFKLGRTGNAQVLRYYAMRGELYELRHLGEKYGEMLSSIAALNQKVAALKASQVNTIPK